ncbi:ABC transporter permease [Pleurocapsales cyanobacterium LEGE 10410]|nr:ABC transporter permease [Pleurocapsales cyanobacterium LEGE 10410]
MKLLNYILKPLKFGFFQSRLWALIVKEIAQIRRNKQLIFLLLFPPIVQLTIFGASLSPEVEHIKLGVVDYARSVESRELVSALTENRVFEVVNYSPNQKVLGQQVETGKIAVGITIPQEFNRNLDRGTSTKVQVLLDGVDAYTSGVASGYIAQIVNRFNLELNTQAVSSLADTRTTFLYNPGLISSWFFVPGIMGTTLTLMSVITSATESVREKDAGTLEQLLMTPASAEEILLAKVAPLFVLLLGDVLIALGVARFIFNVPFQGSFWLFMAISAIYLFTCQAIGILLTTISKSKQQVILTSFFITLPIMMLSGAFAPLESMPTFFAYLSLLNPLRHYITIVRAILLRGVGLEVILPNAIALLIFAVVLITVSANRFRKQVS